MVAVALSCWSFCALPRLTLHVHRQQSHAQTKTSNFADTISFTECEKTKECRHHKQEYDACVARVTKAQEDEDHKGPHEDCVEECTFHGLPFDFMGPIWLTCITSTVFELTHCTMQCAAPKLFKILA